MRIPELDRAIALDPGRMCIMTALAEAFYAEMMRPSTVLKPGMRIDATTAAIIQETLEQVLAGVLREREERPFRIGSIEEMEALGYSFSPEECRGGRTMYADEVRINLDEITLRRERNVRWQLVLIGRRWR